MNDLIAMNERKQLAKVNNDNNQLPQDKKIQNICQDIVY